MNQWKVKGSFEILNDIRNFFTLVHFMEAVGNVNQAVSIVGNWIFDSNYKEALPLKTESLNIICYT